LFIGDSLTGFFDWQRRLPEFEVANLGIAGETVEGLFGRMDEICASAIGPDFIFLMTGINNIAMEEYDIAGTYREILQNVISCFKYAKVVVQSVLPVRLPWVEKERISEINLSLKELSKQSGAAYLDLYSLFIGSDGNAISEYLLEDGVHLSAKGYEKWSEAVEKFIEKSKQA
jgi:lysophospholipase L1-like esterase